MTQSNPLAETESDDQLNKAIQELRGVLHEKDAPAGAVAAAVAGAAAFMPGGAPSGVVMSIPVEMQVVLGRSQMAVSDLMALQQGSTVALDRKIGEPVDIVVNGRKIAKGEIIVMEDDPSRFGIRLTEIISGKGA